LEVEKDDDEEEEEGGGGGVDDMEELFKQEEKVTKSRELTSQTDIDRAWDSLKPSSSSSSSSSSKTLEEEVREDVERRKKREVQEEDIRKALDEILMSTGANLSDMTTTIMKPYRLQSTVQYSSREMVKRKLQWVPLDGAEALLGGLVFPGRNDFNLTRELSGSSEGEEEEEEEGGGVKETALSDLFEDMIVQDKDLSPEERKGLAEAMNAADAELRSFSDKALVTFLQENFEDLTSAEVSSLLLLEQPIPVPPVTIVQEEDGKAVLDKVLTNRRGGMSMVFRPREVVNYQDQFWLFLGEPGARGGVVLNTLKERMQEVGLDDRLQLFLLRFPPETVFKAEDLMMDVAMDLMKDEDEEESERMAAQRARNRARARLREERRAAGVEDPPGGKEEEEGEEDTEMTPKEMTRFAGSLIKKVCRRNGGGGGSNRKGNNSSSTRR